MDVDIILSKNSNEVFGFRLSGGADYAFPATVVRVSLGGLAHKAGIEAGDIVTKINGETIQHLRALEVQDRIAKAGNKYTMTVVRNLKFERNT